MSYFSVEARAQRESYYLVPETCPEIDDALIVLMNELETEIRPDLALATADAKIKKQTNSLRTALIRTMAAKIVAEEALEGAEKEIEDLKEQIKNTKADLRDLEIENDKLDNKLAELV